MELPIVFITATATSRMSVRAMNSGSRGEFIFRLTEPFPRPQALLDAIPSALDATTRSAPMRVRRPPASAIRRSHPPTEVLLLS